MSAPLARLARVPGLLAVVGVTLVAAVWPLAGAAGAAGAAGVEESRPGPQNASPPAAAEPLLGPVPVEPGAEETGTDEPAAEALVTAEPVVEESVAAAPGRRVTAAEKKPGRLREVTGRGSEPAPPAQEPGEPPALDTVVGPPTSVAPGKGDRSVETGNGTPAGGSELAAPAAPLIGPVAGPKAVPVMGPVAEPPPVVAVGHVATPVLPVVPAAPMGPRVPVQAAPARRGAVLTTGLGPRRVLVAAADAAPLRPTGAERPIPPAPVERPDPRPRAVELAGAFPSVAVGTVEAVARTPQLPLGIVAVVVLFLLLQNRIDHRDPKLASARVEEDEPLSFLPADQLRLRLVGVA